MPHNIELFSPSSGRILKQDSSEINIAEAYSEDQSKNVRITTATNLQRLTKEGHVFTLSKRKQTAQNAFHRVFVQAPNDKDVMIAISYSSEDFILFNTYSGVASITGGTVTQGFNRKIGSTETMDTVITYDPTSFTGGTLRGNDFVGSSGATSTRAGGSAGGRN